MKKLMKIMPALTLAAVAFMATSCGGDSGIKSAWNPSATEKPADLKATVTWWNNYAQPDATMSEADARAKSTYTEYFFAKDVITEFNKLYPNITVNQVYKGGYGDIQTAVNTAINSGDTPSIATCYGDHVAGYIKAGAALDVSGCFDDKYIGFGKTVNASGVIVDDSTTTKADFNQNYLANEGKQYSDGLYYSMPYSKSAETMAINQTVFDKVGAGLAGNPSFVYNKPTVPVYVPPVALASKEKYEVPTNWSELIAIARKMKSDFPETFANNVDSDGLFTAVPICWDSAENMYISFSNMLGIPYTANGATVADQVLFNNADAKKMVAQIKKWNNEGLFATQNQLYFSNKAKGYHQYSSTMVTNGKCFVAFSSTAGATYFADGNSFLATLNETPTADASIYSGTKTTAKSKVISQGPSLSFFKKSNEEEQKASWIWYKFLTGTENTAKLGVAKSYFPVRVSSYSTSTVQKLTSASGTVTADSSYADKKNAYTGDVYKLDEIYAKDNRYISTPVFDLSSACRTAVGNLMKTVLDDKTATTDEQINALVETAFTDAYKAVVTQ